MRNIDRFTCRAVVALGLVAVLIPDARAASGEAVSSLATAILAGSAAVCVAGWAIYRAISDALGR